MCNVRIYFGKSLSRKRKEIGLSQEKLGELAGLHRTYISDIERGKRNVSLENIERIAKALGISICELFEGL